MVWLDVLKLMAFFMVTCVHCSDPFNASPDASQSFADALQNIILIPVKFSTYTPSPCGISTC